MTDTSNDAVASMCLAMINSGNTTTANMLTALADERDRLATAHKQLMQSLDAANARADQARDAALVEAADIILADNYDDPDSAAAAILALRAKPAPAATVDAVVSNPLMQEQFADWFRRNYPGPDTIIGDPDWHAPRILNAAIWFINNHKNPRAIAGGGDE